MYEVVIVGAGTAGCVAARELAEKIEGNERGHIHFGMLPLLLIL